MRNSPGLHATSDNLILLTDSYKVSHYNQYPPGTESVYSYFESRGGRFDEVVFFGIQYYLERYFAGVQITLEKIEEAAAFFTTHFRNPNLFNRAGWQYILRTHGGRLPVSIRAVPEGTPVPTRNVLITVENTDPACFWLTNYLETLLVQVWYGSTVATLSREMKKLIYGFLLETGDPGLVEFKLHDFGFRGVSSVESAAVGGAAHLVNFLGTDTLAACVLAHEIYGADMAGFSIPAAEHSTQTAWGPEHEGDAYENMLDQYPSGQVAVVSDSYDIINACRNLWGKRLRDKVLAREGTLVIRADSGIRPRAFSRSCRCWDSSLARPGIKRATNSCRHRLPSSRVTASTTKRRGASCTRWHRTAGRPIASPSEWAVRCYRSSTVIRKSSPSSAPRLPSMDRGEMCSRIRSGIQAKPASLVVTV